MRVIEYDIPIPPAKPGGWNKGQFRTFTELDQIDIGGSFLVSDDERRSALEAVRTRHKATDRRYVTRRMNKGTRIWRVK